MTVLIIFSFLLIVATCSIISGARQARLERVQREQKEELKRQMEEAKKAARERIELAKEQIRLAEEQAKQAERLEKQAEKLEKLERRMAAAEVELSFNREQRDRLMELLDLEELARDSSIKGSTEWQKHQRKVISLEGQLHTVQKRIDKAQWDMKECKSTKERSA